MSSKIQFLWTMLTLASLQPWTAGSLAAWQPTLFNRDIRPILADKCFYCHGPDAAHREADLRLDLRDEAVAAEALVPGKPEASGIVARIFSSDQEQIMPPPHANKTLTTSEKELIKRWISEGGEYQGHWATIKPERPSLPMVDLRNPLANPIDSFVRARLQTEDLEPAAEANRTTLIRRLSFDLVGIPPTPEAVDAFLADDSPRAYEKLVDRLLASPRYGERMAMQWLDYARYADSNGFQTDSSRQMWRWREWVIDAFNCNLPFDQFTIQQLAGDLLPNASRDQIIATGFHRNTRLNGEGGRIVEEWFAETVIDRVDTTGQTWLALTIGCCRCHDHKYDPITQKEFYQLFAFFNSIDESGVLDGGKSGNSRPLLTVPSPEQETEQARLQAAVREAETRTAEAEKELPALQSAWEAKFSAQLAEPMADWKPLADASVTSSGGATFTQQDDGSWLAGGVNPDHDQYTITAPLAPGEVSGLRIEVLPDASLPNQSLGRAPNGNFVLTAVEAEITAPSFAEPLPLAFGRAEADYEQNGYEFSSLLREPPEARAKPAGKKPSATAARKAAKRTAEKTVEKNGEKDAKKDANDTAKKTLVTTAKKGWAIDGNDPQKRLPRKAMLVMNRAVPVPDDARLVLRLKHDSTFASHNIGRFRIDVTDRAPGIVRLDGASVPETIRRALATSPGERSTEQRDELARFLRDSSDNPFTRAATELAQVRQTLADFEASLPTTMVMKELPEPRAAYVLKRGEYDKPADQVERGVPAALPGLPPGAPRNRLGLAQWLVSTENPLVARVWVNRQWEKFFGVGLVKTVDNFGVQSEPPSHPELLDWLATEFMRLEWDMKAMQKRIVMSATYRQASRVTPELLSRDPENRLLARGPRFRLTAELLRDQALAASDLLVERIGGSSVRPYMPEGVWDETSKYGDLRGYQHDRGDGLYRRTLYTIWKRTAAPPTMLMFDSPSREVCTVKRSRTNTPLQALALLNEVTYVEAARALAERMLTAGGSSAAERIGWGFRRVVGRSPSHHELQVLVSGFEQRLAKYRRDPDLAKKLLATGQSQPNPDLDPAELASATLTVNVLLNLDEVVTKE